MRAALVLAAGASRRFGRADKLLAPIRGKALLLHAIARARESDVRRIYVVVSSPHIRSALRDEPGVKVVRGLAGAPLSISLAAGLAAVRPIERELLVFLGDMPAARPPRRLRLLPGPHAARPFWRGQPGHPLLVRTAAARTAILRGDRGLGALPAAGAPGRAGNVLDIDDRAALRRFRLGSRLVPER